MLAAENAPETVAQLVMWHVAAGLDWATISNVAVGPKKWANAQELALARKFVDNMGNGAQPATMTDPGRLNWEVVTKENALQPLANELRTLLKDTTVLGLQVESGIPAQPEGPSVACHVQLVNSVTNGSAKTEALVNVSASDGNGSAWVPMGKFTLPLTGKISDLKATEVADATAEGVLGRLVRAQLTKGPKVKGKDTFKVRIDNASPLILNGLALAGTTEEKDKKTAGLSGISLAPRRSLTINATSDVVDRLGLKNGIRLIAADLSGL
jgi:hypothetical protein